MNSKFTNLAQANVDHYNNHPVVHMLIPVIAVVCLVKGLHVVNRRMAKTDAQMQMMSTHN